MSGLNRFSETDISERIQLLTEVARSLVEDGVLPADKFVLREARIAPMVRAYYLLNDAYKKWRIIDGHNTEKPKIAALQSAIIATFQPFRPLNIADVKTFQEARCNEIYAMAYALSILDIEFTPDTPQKKDFSLRLMDIIAESQVQTVESFIQDTNFEISKSLDQYTLTVLPSDKLALNSLISIFELISSKGALLR